MRPGSQPLLSHCCCILLCFVAYTFTFSRGIFLLFYVQFYTFKLFLKFKISCPRVEAPILYYKYLLKEEMVIKYHDIKQMKENVHD